MKPSWMIPFYSVVAYVANKKPAAFAGFINYSSAFSGSGYVNPFVSTVTDFIF